VFNTDKDYIVTKSNDLINCSYDLSLQEQKIILTLASMVQPKDEDFKPYTFKIKDFMELLGVKSTTKYIEIPKITKELMAKVFEIKRGEKVIQLAWLSSAEYEKGTGLVELEFSPKLKPYMLGLKERYTSYKIGNVLSLRSKYSLRLYEILKSNLYKKDVIIEIEELKKVLRATEKSYSVYRNVKTRIVLQAQKEFKLKTDINFTFEEIKTGRKVTSIKFTINSLDTARNEIAVSKEEMSSDIIKQVQAIFHKHNITEYEAGCILGDARNNIDLIKQCYEYLLTKDYVNNIVGYMRKLVTGFNKPQSNIKIDNFNNFEQRTYDFKKLENKLLGWQE